MTHSFDVAILGAGIAGAGLAAALADSGISVALIEPREPRAPAEAWDSRIYAISPGAVRFLDECGAWAGVDSTRVARIDSMRVYGDRKSTRLNSSHVSESRMPSSA